MESLDDEEIQRLIEEQLKTHGVPDVSEKDEDARLYRLLFTELKNDPANAKASQLAERVVGQIWLKQDRTEQIGYAVSIFAVFLLISGLVYGALVFTNTVFTGGITYVFVAHKSIFIFIVLAFCAIQFLDRYKTAAGKLHN
jgi:hypothetical protein